MSGPFGKLLLFRTSLGSGGWPGSCKPPPTEVPAEMTRDHATGRRLSGRRLSGRRLSGRPLRALALVLALGATLAAGPSGARGRARATAVDLTLDARARPPASLAALSKQIAEVQHVLQRKTGIDTVYIVGGSARAVLDATYGFKPLDMRDLDLFAVTNRSDRSTRKLTGQVAHSLTSMGYTRRQPIERRLRGNPALGARGVNFNAGYGVFLHRPNQKAYLDLSLLRSEAAFQLNGPLNADRIRIPIRSGQTLLDVWRQLRGKDYRQVVRAGVVQDGSGGYEGWRSGRLRLVSNGDIWADVERMKPRLVKSFLKAGAKMPRGLVAQLRATPQLRRRDPELELRYAKRVLALPLPQAKQGLRLLKQLETQILAHPRLRQDARFKQVNTALERPRRWRAPSPRRVAVKAPRRQVARGR